MSPLYVRVLLFSEIASHFDQALCMCNALQTVNRFQHNYVTELNVLNKTLKYSNLYLGLCSFGFLHCVGHLFFTDVLGLLIGLCFKGLGLLDP